MLVESLKPSGEWASSLVLYAVTKEWARAQCYGGLNRRRFEGEQMHVFEGLNPFAAHLKPAQHC